MNSKNISTQIMKALMAALLAGVSFLQAAPVWAKETEPETGEYDFPYEYEDPWNFDYPQNEQEWLDDYETLTDDEKKKVKEVMDELETIYEQMMECYDENYQVIDQTKLEQLEEKEAGLWESISDISDKMVKEDGQKIYQFMTDYVKENEYLTEDEKKQYLDIVDQFYDLGMEIYDALSTNDGQLDSEAFEELINQFFGILDVLGTLDTEAGYQEIQNSSLLTDTEKQTLLEAYAKLDDIYEKQDACFDEKGNLVDVEKYDELTGQEEAILNSIWDIEMKLYADETYKV